MSGMPARAQGAASKKMTRVKNKAAASVQITAEQLLREAQERRLEEVAATPRQTIDDPEEQQEFRLQKRKEFEDQIRKNQGLVGNWLKYAKWEAKEKEFERARSVFERAIDVNHRNVTVWLAYAEMEMLQKQINHARNIWDRAVVLFPRVNTFWQKYTYMEEQLGNVVNAKQIFERWMQWHPDEEAWYAFIKFLMRYKETEEARAVYERFVLCHGETKHWIKYAKFELYNGSVINSRSIYERSVEYFGEENMDEDLMQSYAQFEEGQKEYERARAIYQIALDRIPKARAEKLFSAYTQYEKKYGDRSKVEGVIVDKRRFMYEEEVKKNPQNYDAWFDYIRLCEEDMDAAKTRDVYERAIANVPPANEKRLWRRYIYLWINYAVWEELKNKDAARTRQVYSTCTKVVPNSIFTFAKVWLLYAHFEIRQKDLKAARKILGTALGKCPKEKLFKGYIEIELQFREFDRCRTIYGKYLEFNPANCQTWSKYAELEAILGDIDRARAIFELAVAQPLLDMPEVLWKGYIDFEVELEEHDKGRDLYERLLQKTNHVKVWISYAEFESNIDGDDRVDQARHVYDTADKEVKKLGDKAQRLLLLESRLQFEEENGDEISMKKARNKLPRKIKKRREVFADDGTSEGWEEYYDYIFPDEEANAPNLKLLAMARMWKAKHSEAEDDATTNSADVEGASMEDDDGEEEEEESGAVVVDEFIAAAAFSGSRPGYVFTSGDQGLGYYKDG